MFVELFDLFLIRKVRIPININKICKKKLLAHNMIPKLRMYKLSSTLICISLTITCIIWLDIARSCLGYRNHKG